MKIRTKLIIGFSIMIVLICGMVFVGNDVIKDTRAEFDVLQEHVIPGVIEMSVMKVRVNELRALTLSYAIKGNIDKKDMTLGEEIRITINDLENLAEDHRESGTHIGLVEQNQAEELESMVKQFCSAAIEIVNLKDQGTEISTLVEKREELFYPVLTPLLGQLEEGTAFHMKELGQAGRTINRTYDLGLRLFFLMAGLLTLIAVIVTVVVTRSITKPLHALHRGTEIIGEGNLDYKVATKAKDEIGQLSRAFDEMTDNLKKSTTSIDSLNREIAERKQAEEALRQYEHIVSSSTDMLALVDKRFIYLAANRAYIEAFKLTPERLIGNTVANVFGEEFFNTVIKPNADRCLGGEEVNYQDWFDYPVYGQCYMDITYYPYYSENNEIIGFAMNGRNITERKQAEQALQESEERMRLFMDSATDAFSIWDSELNLVDCNEVRMKMFFPGQRKEEVMGRNMKELHPHFWGTDRYKEFLEIMRTGKPLFYADVVHSNDSFSRPESEQRHLTLRVFKVGDGLGVINTDITERKKAEQALEEKNQQLQAQSKELKDKARELELASQAKSEFLASMSHELRTPLNAVIGFSELMIDEVPGEINEEQRQCLDDILSSGHHLLELINDVLDLSKVEAGKMEFKAEELEISEVIHEVTQTVKPLVNKAGNSLEVKIAEELPQVYADKSRLRQVLLNLLSNAIKFTPKGGGIGIEAHQEGDYCQVSVSDNGIGIKPEDLERVFEVFAQAETLAEKKQEGTGLGLPLTKQFVEKMGGKIWLESEYGKGSSFSFTMPLVVEGERQPDKEEEQEQKLSKIQQNLSQQGKLVLVVDDDRKARTLLRSWLETGGYSIAEASSGDEGISKARELQPKLIILDILMPGKDGWQVLQELKQLPETKGIPVIVSSVTKEEELGFSLGAIDFFVKPVEKKRFMKRVDELELSEEKRVLVVEDNPADMRLVTSILEAEGIGTLSAYDGEEGLRMAEEHLPALIVLDVTMPCMNGFELLERLRQEEKTRSIPVIILTVKDLTQEETKILSQEAAAILKKTGFSREELLAEIRKLV